MYNLVTLPSIILGNLPMWLARIVFGISILLTNPNLLESCERTALRNSMGFTIHVGILYNDLKLGGTSIVTTILGFLVMWVSTQINERQIPSKADWFSYLGGYLLAGAWLALTPFWIYFTSSIIMRWWIHIEKSHRQPTRSVRGSKSRYSQ